MCEGKVSSARLASSNCCTAVSGPNAAWTAANTSACSADDSEPKPPQPLPRTQEITSCVVVSCYKGTRWYDTSSCTPFAGCCCDRGIAGPPAEVCGEPSNTAAPEVSVPPRSALPVASRGGSRGRRSEERERMLVRQLKPTCHTEATTSRARWVCKEMAVLKLCRQRNLKTTKKPCMTEDAQ